MSKLTLIPGHLTLTELRRIHAGGVQRLARVPVNDCGSGVMRHADAGCEIAQRGARERGLELPMLGG